MSFFWAIIYSPPFTISAGIICKEGAFPDGGVGTVGAAVVFSSRWAIEIDGVVVDVGSSKPGIGTAS